jgi:methionine--tRNA ligase beta chain
MIGDPNQSASPDMPGDSYPPSVPAPLVQPSAPPGGPPPATPGEGKTPGVQITIDEFARLDLRVARVVEAEFHPKADRLLKLQIDLGSERRQIVAGIARHYRPEDLVGRLIVVVANMKPAMLRGEPSQGMLLAASWGEVVSLLVPDQGVAPGSEVH